MLGYWPTPEEMTMYRLYGYTIAITDESGTIGTRSLFECMLAGKHHREDGPAYMCSVGESWLLIWYRHGKTHRSDGPAIIRPDGKMVWYQNGKIHRLDGPAIIRPDGKMIWYQNGKTHREDGPAYISDAAIRWYMGDLSHREDGPSVVYHDGELWWYQNGKIHREDGPAVIRPSGSVEWWLDGDKYETREVLERELEHRLENGRAK